MNGGGDGKYPDEIPTQTLYFRALSTRYRTSGLTSRSVNRNQFLARVDRGLLDASAYRTVCTTGQGWHTQTNTQHPTLFTPADTTTTSSQKHPSVKLYIIYIFTIHHFKYCCHRTSITAVVSYRKRCRGERSQRAPTPTPTTPTAQTTPLLVCHARQGGLPHPGCRHHHSSSIRSQTKGGGGVVVGCCPSQPRDCSNSAEVSFPILDCDFDVDFAIASRMYICTWHILTKYMI